MKIKLILFFMSMQVLLYLVCSANNEQTNTVSDDTKVTEFATKSAVHETVDDTIITTTSTETTLTSSTTEVTTVITETIPETLESPSEVIYESVTECAEEEEIPYEVTDYCISELERVMLCNLVGREYGSDYVSVEEKAKIVSVVMNRVNSSDFPNTIYEVLTQPDQFSGYIPSESYTYQVTDSVIQAVDYYFSHSDEFGSYLYFEGDGTWNFFY